MDKNMKILITGAGGLIGSEAVEYFCQTDHEVYGIENNTRKKLFGTKGSVDHRLKEIIKKYKKFKCYEYDIRDRKNIFSFVKKNKFDVIIHTAGQPSHDLAAKIPFEDFDINANGTHNLLESVRQYNKDCIFIFLSTNKVYGDSPNKLPLIEKNTRYEFKNLYKLGINENQTIDQSTHSLFGVSKTAADLLTQEYGRYFGINSCILRCGCLTGQNHSGVKLHGFLNYLIKCCKQDIDYTIFGYNGKQVRDNIHSKDVISFIDMFINKPKISEVYNLGGGFENSISMLEAINKIETISGKKMKTSYSDENRIGDHICYYSDLTKIKSHYPSWNVTVSIDKLIEMIYKSN
jgi:CDP-paratose 2-epimerase